VAEGGNISLACGRLGSLVNWDPLDHFGTRVLCDKPENIPS
jgi:hypothetical protein